MGVLLIVVWVVVVTLVAIAKFIIIIFLQIITYIYKVQIIFNNSEVIMAMSHWKCVFAFVCLFI